jgi:2-oxoglutarate ferredoxin oxidoreductase subunit alpha
MDEAIEGLAAAGQHLNTLRVRAFPFGHEVEEFTAQHDLVFVAEQNRDGQLRTLLMNECGIDPAKLVPVLHYDGSPINARFIIGEIAGRLSASNVTPFWKAAS